MLSQMRPDDHIGKCLFGSAFGEQVEPLHQCGPPPMTFFSQTSPRLYSLSHSRELLGSSRRNTESFTFRSRQRPRLRDRSDQETGLDWVLMRTWA